MTRYGPPDGATPFAVRRDRPLPVRLLLAALILLPLVEVLALVAVARTIGAWATFGLVLAVSAVGVWLVRRSGRRAWRAMRASVDSGQMPEGELADAMVALLGGVLLVVPGFVTDLPALICLLPPTRGLARRVLAALVTVRVSAPSGGGPGASPAGPGGQVIEGEVVQDASDDGPRS